MAISPPSHPGYQWAVTSPCVFLKDLFDAAVASVHPAACLTRFLPPPPVGKLLVLAAGKAAGSMTEVAERHYIDALALPPARLDGIAVTRHGYGRPTRRVALIEAGHPVPDAAGLAAAERMLALAEGATEHDLVLVLISGGASAALIAPAAGVTLAEKQAVTRQLLKSGASIGEINTLRKHLSAIKGGRLTARARPARVVTLAISDVPGRRSGSDRLGSNRRPIQRRLPMRARSRRAIGWSCPMRSRTRCTIPAMRRPSRAMRSSQAPSLRSSRDPRTRCGAAAERVKAAGYECVLLGDRIEGEARAVAAAHAELARDLASRHRRAVILSGGELTVTIQGQGRGGPNQEYALALAPRIRRNWRPCGDCGRHRRYGWGHRPAR